MNGLQSLERIKNSVRSVFNLSNLDGWISKYTNLNGKAFSYKDHEYQIPILRDSAKTSIIVKCAQVGLSELNYRWAIAACCAMDDFTVILTYPSSTDAEDNCKTRIDPLIRDSPAIFAAVNPNLNNSSIKQFNKNSFLFFRGTRSQNQALSLAADAIIHDEFDKSDIEQASVYVSRLQHKPTKIRKLFSTPTVEKYGVSKEAETATRLKHICKCVHCNHMFLPDYLEHVKVPGWDHSLRDITKANLHKIKWQEAALICPKCGLDPDLHHTRMQFVAENPSEGFEANAWYISPFSAHRIITPSYLVQTSTKFLKYSEFMNQSLGLTAEEKNESITVGDIDMAQRHTDLQSSEFHVLGADMGIICHVVIGRIAHDGTYLIVHRAKIHYSQLEEETAKLCAKYRVVVQVYDTQPYVDTVTRLTKKRNHTWGAIFVTAKSPHMFTIAEQEEDTKEGKLNLKLVKINRTSALDGLLGIIKDGTLAIESSELDEEYRNQMLSLKRVQKFSTDGEMVYVWTKTDGQDHFHHATLYFYIAAQLRGMVGALGSTSVGIPLVTRFKPKH